MTRGLGRRRRWLTVAGALFFLQLVPLAQSDQAANGVPRTESGVPDLSGYWTYGSATPLERPEALGDTADLSPEEAAAFLKERYASIARGRDLQLNADWWVPGDLTNGRTSLIVDPPNGRLPDRTVEGTARLTTLSVPLTQRAADGPEDRERYERCIMGRSVPMDARPAPRLMQIFQTAHTVALLNEQNSELRVVPIDGGPRLVDTIRLWRGDGRGHWDSDTLVVETTNFNGKWTFHGAGRDMTLVERLSFIDVNTLQYEFTVTDAASFTSPWTVQFPILRAAGPLYEHACHEGNYSMPLILRGARAEEAAADKR